MKQEEVLHFSFQMYLCVGEKEFNELSKCVCVCDARMSRSISMSISFRRDFDKKQLKPRARNRYQGRRIVCSFTCLFYFSS